MDESGSLLASATFSSESAFGWQQVNFGTPIAIAANTVYVASYHTTTGHYSEDDNYFSNAGVDNPPLHALANSVSGGNGVYAYGANSVFPSLTFNAANYWVDVAFKAGSAPTLTSIAVTPVNPAIVSGTTQQFSATGTYSDSSTQNLTTQVTWNSSQTSVASINTAGLAAALSAGTSTISASFSGLGGSTLLTVQAAPLAITTTSLPNGVANTAYSATLAASGGTLPYTWSVTNGSLPAGLALNAAAGRLRGRPPPLASPA